MDKVAIIGMGHVGRSMQRIFPDAATYDIMPGQWNSREHINAACALALVCVPTPPCDDGSTDLSAVREVCSWLETPIICVKSTVPPTTTDALRAETDKRIVFSSEYVGEGPTWDTAKQATPWPYLIIGGPTDDALPVVAVFRAALGLEVRYYVTDARTAELVKYMENVWLAQQVTFANEFYSIADQLGANWQQARELWALDPRVSPSHTIVYEDDRGFGGKCLPKDLAAIIAASKNAGYWPSFLYAIQEANARFRQ